MNKFSYRDLYSDKKISLKIKTMVTINRMLDFLSYLFCLFLLFLSFELFFN